jgi:hypothetical protein
MRREIKCEKDRDAQKDDKKERENSKKNAQLERKMKD